MPREQETCRCRAYSFPHREGSGRCNARDHGPYCGHCGMACKPNRVDNGIGVYEFHGKVVVDRRIELQSNCCGTSVFDDAELKYKHHDY